MPPEALPQDRHDAPSPGSFPGERVSAEVDPDILAEYHVLDMRLMNAVRATGASERKGDNLRGVFQAVDAVREFLTLHPELEEYISGQASASDTVH